MRGMSANLRGMDLSFVIPAKTGTQGNCSEKNSWRTGVTSGLVKRIWKHRDDISEGSAKRCGVHGPSFRAERASSAEF